MSRPVETPAASGKHSREQRYELGCLRQRDDILVLNLGRDRSRRLLALGPVVGPYTLGRASLGRVLGFLARHDCYGEGVGGRGV